MVMESGTGGAHALEGAQIGEIGEPMYAKLPLAHTPPMLCFTELPYAPWSVYCGSVANIRIQTYILGYKMGPGEVEPLGVGPIS